MDNEPAKTSAERPGKFAKHSRTVAAAILAAGIVGASLLFLGGGGPVAEPVAAEQEPAAEGPIVETDPVTLSLRDGSYLKIGIAFQLRAEEADEGDTEEESAAAEDFGPARALDLVVSTYNEFTKNELMPARGRAAAKKLLGERIVAAYDGEVTGIYLTTFVMQ